MPTRSRRASLLQTVTSVLEYLFRPIVCLSDGLIFLYAFNWQMQIYGFSSQPQKWYKNPD